MAASLQVRSVEKNKIGQSLACFHAIGPLQNLRSIVALGESCLIGSFQNLDIRDVDVAQAPIGYAPCPDDSDRMKLGGRGFAAEYFGQDESNRRGRSLRLGFVPCSLPLAQPVPVFFVSPTASTRPICE